MKHAERGLLYPAHGLGLYVFPVRGSDGVVGAIVVGQSSEECCGDEQDDIDGRVQ